MKLLPIVTISILASCFVFAKQSGGPFYADKSGNMRITGLSKIRTEIIDPKTIKITARAPEGRKVKGVWKSQRMTLEAGDLVAFLVSQGKKQELSSANLSGGVHAVLESDSQTTDVVSTRANYSATKNELEMPEPLVMTNHSVDERKLEVRGNSGTLLFDSARTLSSAHLVGPIKMTLSGSRTQENEKTHKSSQVPFLINGRAKDLVYKALSRTILLTGDVHVDGDDPMFGGDLSAKTALITLNAKGEIVSIDMDGDPGTTILKDKGGLP